MIFKLRVIPNDIIHFSGLDFSETFRLWVLHTLWLSVDTGGLSFSCYVQPTQAILFAHTQYDSYTRPRAISHCIARIIHSVVAAVGPELAVPSASTIQFLNLWHVLRKAETPEVQLEAVRTLHQLILWSSPLDLPSLYPTLSSALTSSSAKLRKAGIKCLSAWAEKEPNMIFQRSWHKLLLQMLDKEPDLDVAEQIQRAFQDFLNFALASNEDDDKEMDAVASNSSAIW